MKGSVEKQKFFSVLFEYIFLKSFRISCESLGNVPCLIELDELYKMVPLLGPPVETPVG